MSNQINISIVIPIFNEEESIGQLVSEVLNAMKKSKENFEIILVNDGSKDKSAEVLKSLCKDIPELTGVLLRKNYGLILKLAYLKISPVNPAIFIRL